MATRMQQRRGTAAQWTQLDPVLADGEIGVMRNDTDTTDIGFKIGDGRRKWSQLPIPQPGPPGPQGPAAPVTGTNAQVDQFHVISSGALSATPFNATPLGILGGGQIWQGVTLRAETAPVGSDVTVELRGPNKTTVLTSAKLPEGSSKFAVPMTWTLPNNDLYYIFVTGRGSTVAGSGVTIQFHVQPPTPSTTPPVVTPDFQSSILASWSARRVLSVADGGTVSVLADQDGSNVVVDLTAVGEPKYRQNAFGPNLAGVENAINAVDPGVTESFYKAGNVIGGNQVLTMMVKFKFTPNGAYFDGNIIGQELAARLAVAPEAAQQTYRRVQLLVSNTAGSWAVNSASNVQLPVDTLMTLALRVGEGFAQIDRVNEDGTLTQLVKEAFTGTIPVNTNWFGLMGLNDAGGWAVNGTLRAARVYQSRLTDAQLHTVRASEDFATATVVTAPPTQTVRINAGGPAFGSYSADSYFANGGQHTTTRPELLALEPMYTDYRYGQGGVLTYNIPATRRSRVRIYTAEPTFPGPGGRQFDIIANGGKVFQNIDLASAPGPYLPAVFEYVTDPVNGFIRVEMVASADNPIVAGIEVLDAVDANLTPVVVNTGGGNGGGVVNPTPVTGSGSIFGNEFTDLVPSGSGMLAYPAQDLPDSTGAAVHVTYDGQYQCHTTAGRQQFEKNLVDLGINRIRDGYGWQREALTQWLKGMATRIPGFELTMTNDTRDYGWGQIAGSLDQARQVRDEHLRTGLTSIIKFWEGPNEWDASRRHRDAATWQNFFADAIAEHAATKHIQVATMSFASLNDEFLYTEYGQQPKMKYGTSHAYPGNNYVFDDAIMDRMDRHFEHVASGKNMILTETGVHTAQAGNMAYRGQTEDSHRTFIPMLALDAFRRGRWQGPKKIVRTFFYELYDDPRAEEMESRFGLIRSDRTSFKPGAVSLSRLMHLCKDPGARPAISRYNINVTNGDAKTKTVLLRKSNGRVLLIIWQQERTFNGSTTINPPDRTVTVSLPTSPNSITRWQPTQTAQGVTITPATSFTVNSSEDITVLEIAGLPSFSEGAGGGATTPITPPVSDISPYVLTGPNVTTTNEPTTQKLAYNTIYAMPLYREGPDNTYNARYSGQVYNVRDQLMANLKAEGWTGVRLAVASHMYNDQIPIDTIETKAEYIERVVGYVNSAKAQGLRTIIGDWSSLTAYGSYLPTRFHEAYALIDAMVTALGPNNPWVTYEPFNEPNHEDVLYHGVQNEPLTPARWVPPMKGVIQRYRQAGYMGILFINTPGWSWTFPKAEVDQLLAYDASLRGSASIRPGQHQIIICNHVYSNGQESFSNTLVDYETNPPRTRKQIWESEIYTRIQEGYAVFGSEYGYQNGGQLNMNWQREFFKQLADVYVPGGMVGFAGFLAGNWGEGGDQNRMHTSNTGEAQSVTEWGRLAIATANAVVKKTPLILPSLYVPPTTGTNEHVSGWMSKGSNTASRLANDSTTYRMVWGGSGNFEFEMSGAGVPLSGPGRYEITMRMRQSVGSGIAGGFSVNVSTSGGQYLGYLGAESQTPSSLPNTAGNMKITVVIPAEWTNAGRANVGAFFFGLSGDVAVDVGEIVKVVKMS